MVTSSARVGARGLVRPSPGFGLGLRTAHYQDFLSAPQPVDWLEVISDNHLVPGGKPMRVLDAIRQDYPMALHGVALSIGSVAGPDAAYLGQLRALADRIDPLWVSDHLCWTGVHGRELHDLLPLPYTEEALGVVVRNIAQVQEALGRRLVLENVSSYVQFAGSQLSEWDFLREVAERADCLLLVDVNNVHVSSVNHGFDALGYLHALPAHRVQQIHLAGHTDHGDVLVDTHDQPVPEPVWALYAEACRLWGPVATMIERDDHMPPLPELLAELDLARAHACQAMGTHRIDAVPRELPRPAARRADASSLLALQTRLVEHLLQSEPGRCVDGGADGGAPAHHGNVDRHATHATQATELTQALFKDVQPPPGTTTAQAGGAIARRLGVYHSAYRARLLATLRDSHGHTLRLLGDEVFDALALAHIEQSPPEARNLRWYGEAWPDTLVASVGADIAELARLDWALRCAFDGPDDTELSLAELQNLAPEAWATARLRLHATVCCLSLQHNTVARWHAIDQEEPPPPGHALDAAVTLLVWRRDERPHFRSLDPLEAWALARLQADPDWAGLCDALAEAWPHENATVAAARCLRRWVEEGVLAAIEH
jgi:uncharacterized protein (UPF0276 family)